MPLKQINYDPQFKPVKSIYENRLRQFIDNGGYKDLNLPKFYDKQRIHQDGDHVKIWYYQVPWEKGFDPTSPDVRPSWKSIINADKNGEIEWKNTYGNQPFGPSWTTTWFKVNLTIPQDWIDSGDQLVFEFNCDNEGIVIDPETLVPYTAFSGNERKEYDLPRNGDGKYFFYIECGNNGMFGVGSGGTNNPPDPNRYFHLTTADIVWPDWDARALFFDFWELSDAARELPDDSWQKNRARQIGNEVMNLFDPYDRASVVKCRDFLKSKYYDKYNDSDKVYSKGDLSLLPNVYAMGNCHIDTAWLWPWAETHRKIIRSWSSQTTLMEKFPEYQFVASQAQQFKWLMDEHPEFFYGSLIPKVEQGQFYPVGGSWVENDTNIPQGESLCRQFLLGQRFFIKHFGAKSTVFWLPDTFGYSSQIPQICRISGIERFLTQKLSWNNIDNFPHSTFNWVGIDGSQVLTHMPPGNTYTSDANFGDVLRTAKQNKTQEFYEPGLMLYGKGDGGGGPTREQLEKLRRIRSLYNRNGNVVPKVQLGLSIDQFYDNILERTDHGEELPAWLGELYLEFHRGTYTTQAKMKQLMRSSEIKLHDLEWIATKTSLLYPGRYRYPASKINDLWENVLLCQFHDVLPGSCIELVYKYEAIPMLENALKEADKLLREAQSVLVDNAVKTKDKASVGTLAWCKEDFKADTSDFVPATCKIEDDMFVLNNGELTVKVSKHTGVITSIVNDKTKTEYIDIRHGRNRLGANQFVLFDDEPTSFPAWDTELYSVNKYKYLTDVEKVELVSSEASGVTVEVVLPVHQNCRLKTQITLKGKEAGVTDESKVDIHTKIENWGAFYHFLKVEFPVNVFNDFASYETQFGITKRPTHYNTSWDTAKFEVCHHKFADYSEYTKGVSILNDCKYGFSTHGNLMRLSLLRSSKAPDANADMGDHAFSYAIYPHRGPLSHKTVKLGLEFNYRYKFDLSSETAEAFDKFITLGGDPNVVLSNIKRGEDDKSIESQYALHPEDKTTIVVRVYESLGGESTAILTTSLPIKEVLKIDSLETKSLEKLHFHTNKGDAKLQDIPINLRPFEIGTYKLVL